MRTVRIRGDAPAGLAVPGLPCGAGTAGALAERLWPAAPGDPSGDAGWPGCAGPAGAAAWRSDSPESDAWVSAGGEVGNDGSGLTPARSACGSGGSTRTTV